MLGINQDLHVANVSKYKGAKIQSELCDNLQVALETMQNLSGIYKDLELGNFNDISSPFNAIPDIKESQRNITFNSNPVFNIDNNGSEIDYNEIQKMIDDSNGELVAKITKF